MLFVQFGIGVAKATEEICKISNGETVVLLTNFKNEVRRREKEGKEKEEGKR